MTAAQGPARRSRPKRLARTLIAVAVTLGLITALVAFGPATDLGRAFIVRLANGVRVGNLGWLSLSNLSGDPWSDFTVGRLQIADRRGPWLTVDKVRVRWRSSRLWRRRLEIADVSAGVLTLRRRPQLLPAREGEPGGRLPVSLQVDKASALAVLTPEFAWRRGEYQLDGAIDVERAKTLSGRLTAVSLTQTGDFLRATFDFRPTRIDLETHAQEARGGALGGSLGVDPLQPFGLDVRAHGSRRAGWFALTSAVGSASPATAAGRWSAVGANAAGRIDLTASRWLAPWRTGVGPAVTFQIDATRVATNFYSLAMDARGAHAAFAARGQIALGRWRIGPAGLAVTLSVAALSPLAGVDGLGRAGFAGAMTGDEKAWRLVGKGEVDQVRTMGLNLDQVGGPFELTGGRSGLVLKAKAVGAGPSARSLGAVLLGSSPKGEGEIDWLTGGRILVRRLQIRGAAIEVDAEGRRGLFGGLAFEGQARIPDLSNAARGAKGAISADWRASQARDNTPWSFDLRATGQAIRLPSRDLNGVVGSAPETEISGRLDADGVEIVHGAVKGGAVAATGSGTIGYDGALKLALAGVGSGPLTLGPAVASGASRFAGALSGTIDHPQLEANATIGALDLPVLSTPRLRDANLTLSVVDDGARLSGRTVLDASSDVGPARAAAAFQVWADQWSLSGLDIDAGGAHLAGSISIQKAHPTAADLTFALERGAFLAGGRVAGRFQVVDIGGSLKGRLSLKGADLVFPSNAGVLDAVNVTADGPIRRLPYKVDARGEALGLRGRLSGSGQLTVVRGEPAVSFQGAGRIGAADVQTMAPAEIAWRRTGLMGSLRLAVGQGGRAAVSFTTSGAGLSGRAALDGLELALVDPNVVGRADGVVTFNCLGNSLIGTAQSRVTGLAGRDLNGSTPLAGSVDATFGGQAVALTAHLTDTTGSSVSADLHLPATLSVSPFALSLDTRRPIDGRFSVDGAIDPVWNLLEAGGQSLTGRVAATGAIAGTLADPRITGSASVDGGTFEDAGLGLRLTGITARAAMRGDAVDVAEFSAADGYKGSVSGSGRLSLLRGGASGFRLNLKGFRLVDNAEGQATASGAVNVDRATDGRVRLSGALTIDRALISPTPPTPSGVIPMDVVEIHQSADTGPFVAAPAEREPPVALDIALKAPGGVFIKGRGLNIELSLDSRVSGSTDAPRFDGLARVIRGDYDFAGKRFQVDDSSSVRLGSTPEAIRLDLTATRDDPNLTAVVKIGGTAAAPTLTLSSTPALPQDEILSQVLFGASSAQLSGPQAAQLASAVAGLAGGGGLDFIGGLRTLAHLDRLAIDTSAAAGFTVAGGKYVTDRLYVELSNSAKTGQGAQVEWRVKKHLSIVSRVTDQGDHAVSVRWRKDY